MPLSELLSGLEATHDTEHVESRTTDLLILRPRAGVTAPALVVKHCEPRHVPSPQVAFDAFVQCDEAGRATGVPIVPAPHSWGEDPPYVCVEYEESRRHIRVVMALLASDADADHVEAAALAELAGRTLARFHAAMRPSDEELRDTGSTSPKLLWLARLLVGAPSGPGTPYVRLHTDFGMHNLILLDDGSLLIVDLPGEVRLGAPEEDLGRLVDALSRRTPRTDDRLRSAVIDAALEGYEAEAGVPVRTGKRRALVEAMAARHALLLLIAAPRQGLRRSTRFRLAMVGAARRRARANK